MFSVCTVLVLLLSITEAQPETAATYADAENKCRKLGTVIADQPVDGATSLPTWLPYKRHRFLTWLWLDGDDVGTSFADQPWGDRDCGVLDLDQRAMEVDMCSIPTHGYICESRGTTCESLGLPSMSCFIFNQTVYTHFCDSRNWYSARQQCHALGMSLAVIKTDSLTSAIAQAFHPGNKCKTVWIGLRREEWNETENGTIGDLILWGLDEPKPRGGECAVKDHDIMYGWRAASCNQSHHFVCKEKSGPPDSPHDPCFGVMVGTVVLGILLVVCAAGFISHVLWRHCSSGKAEKPDGGRSEMKCRDDKCAQVNKEETVALNEVP